MNDHLEAKHTLNVLEARTSATETKRKALENLVSLSLKDWHGTPKIKDKDYRQEIMTKMKANEMSKMTLNMPSKKKKPKKKGK
jgi:hypothetical protein